MRMQKPRIRLVDRAIARYPVKVADSFYSSVEWRELMTTILRQRGRNCQSMTCSDPRKPGVRYGDHITELSDGGAALDPGNVMVMCAVCHGQKTHAARLRRLSAPIA